MVATPNENFNDRKKSTGYFTTYLNTIHFRNPLFAGTLKPIEQKVSPNPITYFN